MVEAVVVLVRVDVEVVAVMTMEIKLIIKMLRHAHK